MRKLFFAIMFTVISLSAFGNNYPTIEIDGKNYFLADSDDNVSEWFQTMDGYCAKTGKGTWGSGQSTVENVGPLVRLSSTGDVVTIYPNNGNGNIWVITEIACE